MGASLRRLEELQGQGQTHACLGLRRDTVIRCLVRGNVAAIQAYKDANIASKREQMVSVLKRKLQYVEENQAKLRIGSKEIEVSKRFDSALTAVLKCKDVVSSAVSAEPHAAIAWAGVCVILPVSKSYSHLISNLMMRLTFI